LTPKSFHGDETLSVEKIRSFENIGSFLISRGLSIGISYSEGKNFFCCLQKGKLYCAWNRWKHKHFENLNLNLKNVYYYNPYKFDQKNIEL